MKIKQLEQIRQQFSNIISRQYVKPPELQAFVMAAIVNGEAMKLKTANEVIRLVRQKIIEDRYDRNIKIHELFAECDSYRLAKAEWDAKEKSRQKLVKAFRKIADPLLRAAELSDTADAEQIAASIEEAADEVGLFASPVVIPDAE